MLVFRGDFKKGEDQRDDEYVIHRKRQFDEIAGDEFERFLFAAQRPQSPGEQHRQGKPDAGPDERLLETHDMGVAVKHAKVKRQKNQHSADESNPMPGLISISASMDRRHQPWAGRAIGTCSTAIGPDPMCGRLPLCHQSTSALAM